MNIFSFALIAVCLCAQLTALLDEGHSVARQKRYYIVTEHANQVLKAVEEYRSQKEKSRASRVRRDWMTAMSSEEVRNRLSLHNIIIKKKHHV